MNCCKGQKGQLATAINEAAMYPVREGSSRADWYSWSGAEATYRLAVVRGEDQSLRWVAEVKRNDGSLELDWSARMVRHVLGGLGAGDAAGGDTADGWFTLSRLCSESEVQEIEGRA